MKILVTRDVYEASGNQVHKVEIPQEKIKEFLAIIKDGSPVDAEEFIEEFGIYGDIVDSELDVTRTEFSHFEIEGV